jgi:hypothetical protein
VRRALVLICLTGCRFGFEARTTGDGGGDAIDGLPGPDVAFGDCWDAWRTGPLTLSPPQPVDALNTTGLDGDPFLSTDALTIYFSRGVGTGGDFYVATRPDRYSPFAGAAPITELNTLGDETKLTLTSDGRLAFWSTNRTGSMGFDIWEASRSSATEMFGAPVQTSLGQINDNANQFDPHVSGDGLRLYVAPQSAPNQFIQFATRMTTADNFGTPVMVSDLGANRSADPTLSPDELVIVYSARQSAADVLTIWYATRPDTGAAFSGAQRIASLSDGTIHDQDPAVSFDGCELYFSRHTPDPELYLAVVQ